MGVSGSWNFSVTRDQIIAQAMLDIGVLGEAENPTAQEASDCAFKLNLLVKQWMGKQDFAPGLKMWTRQRGDLFLGNTKFQYELGPTGDNWAAGVTGGSLGQTYGQTTLSAAEAIGQTVLSVTATSQMNANDYIGIQCGQDLFWTTIVSKTSNTVTITDALTTAGVSGAYVFNYTTKQQRPLEIVTVLRRDIYNQDTPVRLMTLQTYENLPSKTDTTFQSDPQAIYYESQLDDGQLYLDVGGAQDVTKHLHIVFLRPVMDFDTATDNPEYPQQWYRALCWGLGKDIAPMFDAEWTENMESNFTMALAMAQEADGETTSMHFTLGGDDP